MTQFKSDFAVIDITSGHKRLADMLPDAAPIPVTLTGHIVSQWSSDDGSSIQFEVKVGDLTITLPTPQT